MPVYTITLAQFFQMADEATEERKRKSEVKPGVSDENWYLIRQALLAMDPRTALGLNRYLKEKYNYAVLADSDIIKLRIAIKEELNAVAEKEESKREEAPDPEPAPPVEDIQRDAIQNPAHYAWYKDKYGMDLMDVLDNWSYKHANILKYLLRYSKKGTPLQDLKKAQFLLNYLHFEEGISFHDYFKSQMKPNTFYTKGNEFESLRQLEAIQIEIFDSLSPFCSENYTYDENRTMKLLCNYLNAKINVYEKSEKSWKI